MRRPALVAAALFALTLLSRAPFAADRLWAWDSVLYARALEDGFHVDYALAGQRPHPPGYFLYVSAAALARGVVGDSNAALVLVSAVASALAVAALYLFARRFMRDRVALLVAAGFAVDPLVWTYSEVAYPYTLLALLSIALAAMLLAARGHGARAAILASLGYGAALGFRQDLLVVLGPLWVWMLWPCGARARLAALAALVGGATVWVVPTVAFSGGPAAYANALVRQADFVRTTYSVTGQGLPALGVNLATTAYALAWGLAVFALPLAVLALADARSVLRARRLAAGATQPFLVLWTAPGLLLYVALHIGEWGYVLSVLPGLYVLAGIGIERLAAMLPRPLPLRPIAIAAALVPGLVFLSGPGPFSSAAITRHDRELATRVRYVRDHYSPSSTLVLAREDFLLVRYYLPEYRAWFHDPEPFKRTMRRKRASNVTAMVVFTPGLKPASSEARRVTCAKDVELVYLDVEPGSVVELEGERYRVVEAMASR